MFKLCLAIIHRYGNGCYHLNNFNYTGPWTICVQYLRIMFSTFREEDFQKFCIELVMFKLLSLAIISPMM